MTEKSGTADEPRSYRLIRKEWFEKLTNDKFLSMLGLARRAGKISMGFDSAVGSAAKKETELIFITRDISPKSLKELKFALCGSDAEIIEIPYDIEDMDAAVGKHIRIVSINDSGFAAQLKKLINASCNGEE